MHRRIFLAAAAALPFSALAARAAAPEIRVVKSATCGCCSAWEKHLKAEGFLVSSHAVPDEELWEMKARLGLTDQTASCHTGMIEGYIVEGHVPAADIRRLLAEKPKALGLTVPGMPIGSPGMGMGDEVEPYDTLLILPDGRTEVFQSHS